MKEVTVFGKKVLLKPQLEGEKTSSGLLISQSKGERTEAWALRMQVILVGEEVDSDKIKPGDWVYVNKWEVVYLHLDGVMHAIAKEEEISIKE